MIKSDLVGDEHLSEPFSVGRVDARRPFVHVFDDFGLQLVMNEIDTAPDFVEYLTKRESLLTSPNRIIVAPGEEELLGSYLTNVDETGAHSFLAPGEADGFDGLAFSEGGWNHYFNHPQRQAKINANEVSYLWDRLLEHLIEELPERPLASGSTNSAELNRERALRVMASESRLVRRMLGTHLIEVMESTVDLPPLKSFVRVGYVRERSDTAYVFLVLAPGLHSTQEEYQTLRSRVLSGYCDVLAIELPEARNIIGIGIVPPGHAPASETLYFLNTDSVTEDFRSDARRIQDALGILKGFRERLQFSYNREYPED